MEKTLDAPGIWWKEIPTPARFCASIIGSIMRTGSAIIGRTGDLSWPHILYDLIEINLSDRFLRVEKVAWKETNYNHIGHKLLDRYASGSIRAGYRPVIDIVEYLAYKGVLKDRLFFIDCDEAEEAIIWDRFFARYNQYKTGPVYACICCNVSLSDKVQYKPCIFEMDRASISIDAVLFAELLASHRQMPKEALDYAARLAVSLADYNIELIEEIIRHSDLLNDEPSAIIHRYLQEPLPKSILDQRVWRAQIQSLFYFIEELRLRLVDMHREDILPLLPHTDNFGFTAYTPEEAEIGMLAFLLTNDAGKGYLRLNKEESKLIIQLRDLRNKLAHRQPISLDELNIILYRANEK